MGVSGKMNTNELIVKMESLIFSIFKISGGAKGELFEQLSDEEKMIFNTIAFSHLFFHQEKMEKSI